MKEMQAWMMKMMASVSSQSASFIHTGDVTEPTCNQQLLTENEGWRLPLAASRTQPCAGTSYWVSSPRLNHSAIAATGSQEETRQAWYHLGLPLVEEALVKVPLVEVALWRHVSGPSCEAAIVVW